MTDNSYKARKLRYLRYLRGHYEYDIRRKEAELDEMKRELDEIIADIERLESEEGNTK